jgi:hypothetical protein
VTWRDDFRTWALQAAGHLFYCYGAQDLDAGLVDCSGLVIEVLKKHGKIPIGYDGTAQQLAGRYPLETLDPQPGDLGFWGKNWTSVQHVNFVFGPFSEAGQSWPLLVCGMLGGDKHTVGEIGRLFGRGFHFAPAGYWPSMFLGWRKVD